jgi:hypothetical protein
VKVAQNGTKIIILDVMFGFRLIWEIPFDLKRKLGLGHIIINETFSELCKILIYDEIYN